MAIPAHLDTFITEKLMIEPMMVINKETMSPAIFVKVMELPEMKVIESHIFKTEKEYRDFVQTRI